MMRAYSSLLRSPPQHHTAASGITTDKLPVVMAEPGCITKQYGYPPRPVTFSIVKLRCILCGATGDTRYPGYVNARDAKRFLCGCYPHGFITSTGAEMVRKWGTRDD